MTVIAATWLPQARLHVELLDSHDRPILHVRSSIDPHQDFLLPVWDEPTCAGLALHTALGALHALCWGFAYGAGPLPAGSRVRFSSGTLRHQQALDVGARHLGPRCWVADAEGVFSYASLLSDAGFGPCVRLAGPW